MLQQERVTKGAEDRAHYSDLELNEIIAHGSLDQWKELESQIDLPLCAQIKRVCDPNTGTRKGIAGPHWFGVAHKFQCNEAAKKSLSAKTKEYKEKGLL